MLDFSLYFDFDTFKNRLAWGGGVSWKNLSISSFMFIFSTLKNAATAVNYRLFQNLAAPWISFRRRPCFESSYQLCRSTYKQNNDIIVLIFAMGGKALELVTLRISFLLKLQGGGRASRSENYMSSPLMRGDSTYKSVTMLCFLSKSFILPMPTGFLFPQLLYSLNLQRHNICQLRNRSYFCFQNIRNCGKNDPIWKYTFSFCDQISSMGNISILLIISFLTYPILKVIIFFLRLILDKNK